MENAGFLHLQLWVDGGVFIPLYTLEFEGKTQLENFADHRNRQTRMEKALTSNRSIAGGFLFSCSRLLLLFDASAAGDIFARDDARGTSALPLVSIRDDVEKRAGWPSAGRRHSPRFHSSAS